MKRTASSIVQLYIATTLVPVAFGGVTGDEASSEEELACRALADIRNLTIISAELVDATESTPKYCYVKGIISPAILYHVQLPVPANWNGRFVNWGDGGKDGDLDFSNHRVAQGYAVANSNTGHDNGSEPGASFGFNNRQGEIDFGYRAVHLTVNTAKRLIKAYYSRGPEYSYHEGCSTGGRQGLIEAQRFPYDFDGIVAGAPVNYYQELNITHVWTLQQLFRDNFAGNLAFDTDGDGSFDSLRKAEILKEAVLAKCDANDGITDGVIDDPLACHFNPELDLASNRCEGDINGDDCFTTAQIETIKDIYSGSYDSKGVSIFKGKALGSESTWPSNIIPHAGNSNFPALMALSGDHINYLFYETDPGIAVPDLTKLSYVPEKTGALPEWAWWEINIDDFTAGKGDFMKWITNAEDPDLRRFLIKNGGKLILYHGWSDGGAHPEPTLDYYKEVVDTTFGGDIRRARNSARLFMAPGMAHCGGGPGPNDWDRLAPLVEWVENGKAPDFVIATHSTNGVVDNERPICAYPQQAVYKGPSGAQNDPANWKASNFACR
ncbi:tannase/feruloyl esterase family alpha/beta hydrolase [Acidobacteria bacterium AH-259-D05]|nr:tannase/feruloyl esterase family alpha/beta hydrolase [Acidobacteria bacterium AH-259-D05]